MPRPRTKEQDRIYQAERRKRLKEAKTSAELDALDGLFKTEAVIQDQLDAEAREIIKPKLKFVAGQWRAQR